MAIKSIQFRRGTQAVLEAKLKDGVLGVPADGEPIFEHDHGRLKIGDGVTEYAKLDYIGGSEGGEDPRFVIVDPVGGQILSYDATSKKWVNKDSESSIFEIADPKVNQVLLYDATLEKWVNKNLTDENSLVYLDENGLTIKGYNDASQGQMLVKDKTNGLAWIDPLSTETLETYTESARESAAAASQYATNAGNSASSADTSAQQASALNQTTINFVNNKFWWGTQEEYNALESITSGTFYFIRSDN